MFKTKKILLCLIAVVCIFSISVVPCFAEEDPDGFDVGQNDSEYSYIISDNEFEDDFDDYDQDYDYEEEEKEEEKDKNTDTTKYNGKSAAEVQSLNLEVGIDKSLKMPLTLKRDTEQFYLLGNANPGDTLKGSVNIKNTSAEPAQVALSNVVKNAGMSEGLLPHINVTISVGDDPIYSDTLESLIHLGESKTDESVTLSPWINVEPGKEIVLHIQCDISRDLDNEFQAAVLDTNWIFDARADVPEDPEEIEETNPGKDYYEVIEVDKDDTVTTGQRILGIVIVSTLLALAIVAIVITAKKKKK